MNRKDLIDKFLNNEVESEVPVAFWHHFVSFHNHYNYDNKEIFETVLSEQKKYIDEVKPDFIKIMSDGFFGHPSLCTKNIQTIEEISEVKAVGENHEWINKQVEYVKEVCEYAGDDVYKYYNIFSPLQYIRLRFEEYDEDFTKFVRLLREDIDAVTKAAKEIASDIKILIKRLFAETKIDGIYYSVQAVQDKTIDHEFHKKYVESLDLLLLNYINEFTDNVLLHICGYAKYTNELSWYKDYPVKAFNWAVFTENISLEEGKKIFNDKPVLGGFDNALGSILYTGSEEELKKYIYDILDKTKMRGIGLGADCTISENIEKSRLELIRKIAREYTKK